MLARVFDWAEEGVDGGEGRSGARHRKRRRRRRGLVVLLVLLLLMLGLATAGYSYYRWCEGSSGPRAPLTVAVPRGASGGDVVSMLHRQGVIRCGLVSKVALRTRNQTFEAGRYHLTTNMSLGAALDSLDRGPVAPPSVRLTIPEGWRLTQIAARVQSVLHVPSAAFLRLAQSGRYTLPPYLPRGSPSVEGFLFPDTYQFPRHGNTAASVIRRLLQGFRSAVRSL